MDILRFTDDFFAMEKELDLFSSRIDGLPWWDPVRHDVFYFIYYRLSGATLVPLPQSSFLKRARRLATRRWLYAKLRLKLLIGRYDVLAMRAPRLATAGREADLILDDVLACTPGRVLVIDTYPHYYHVRLPAKIDRPVSSSEWCHLNAAVKDRFGRDLDVESMVALRFAQYRAGMAQYGSLLDKAAPKVVVLVQNGIEKALFHAASSRSIPVVEAQHGLINRVHPAYSYPTNIAAGALATLPTVFLTFAQHWVTQCHYPVATSVVIGNRQLFVDRTQADSGDILVISADIYETALEDVLRPAAQALTQRRFVYKLHPNQFHRRREIEERLADLPNVGVIADQETIRQLLKRCNAALCVQSTAVYEALQAGLMVYLLAALDYETHADVFEHPSLRVVRNDGEFAKAAAEARSLAEPSALPVFFQDFDAAATTTLMNRLAA